MSEQSIHPKHMANNDPLPNDCGATYAQELVYNFNSYYEFDRMEGPNMIILDVHSMQEKTILPNGTVTR